MVDRLGQQYGNYRLTRLLGQGGFAEVYLGEHVHLSSQAAIKILHTRFVTRDQEQFLQEARTIATLEHPAIVRILDFGIEPTGGDSFLVMNFASHGTLRQRYPKGTCVPLGDIALYMKQIASALQYAHDHKLIHRDVKPENILLGNNDKVLLSDFGIALLSTTSNSQNADSAAGTVAYMAPEQILGKPVTASDQYALGIVVYEWICGRLPFSGSFPEMCAQHLYAPLPALTRPGGGTIPPRVEQVVLKALAKDARLRFGSIQEFASALEQAIFSATSAYHTVVAPDVQPLSGHASTTVRKAPRNTPAQSALPRDRSTIFNREEDIPTYISTAPDKVPAMNTGMPTPQLHDISVDTPASQMPLVLSDSFSDRNSQPHAVSAATSPEPALQAPSSARRKVRVVPLLTTCLLLIMIVAAMPFFVPSFAHGIFGQHTTTVNSTTTTASNGAASASPTSTGNGQTKNTTVLGNKDTHATPTATSNNNGTHTNSNTTTTTNGSTTSTTNNKDTTPTSNNNTNTGGTTPTVPGQCITGYVWRQVVASDHVCVSQQTHDQVIVDNSQAKARIDPNAANGPDACISGYVWRQVVASDHVCVSQDEHNQVISDNSSAQSRINPNAGGQDTCVQGYVWRQVVASDHVCVTPDERNTVIADNNQASSRIDPQGASGPDSCVTGYVWRQALTNDHVCVTPQQRDLVASDNSAAQSRIDPNAGSTTDACITGYVWREALSNDHVCVTPQQRDQVASDNNQAQSRIDPNAAKGPDACISGYVWREAISDDHVCVTQATHDQAAYDNSQAQKRVVH